MKKIYINFYKGCWQSCKG